MGGRCFGRPAVGRTRRDHEVEGPVRSCVVGVRAVGLAAERSLERVRVDERGRIPLDEAHGIREADDLRRRDRPLVGERVDERQAAHVDERDPVGGAVLNLILRAGKADHLRSRVRHDRGIGDDEVGAGIETVLVERRARVLRPVEAVDEDDGLVVEVNRRRRPVEDLDELQRVGANIVVVDLVDHQVVGRCGARPTRGAARRGTQRQRDGEDDGERDEDLHGGRL